MQTQRTLLKIEVFNPQDHSAQSIAEQSLKLDNCDTRWTAHLIVHTDQTSGVLYGHNFCKQRNCGHKPCMAYRISKEHQKFKVLFSCFRRNQASHVTLTFGQNMAINGNTLAIMREYVKKLFRQINYKASYRAVIIYELKLQPNGLYHRHVHIAFERSPHLNTLVKKWNKIMGNTTRIDVKYNTSKIALARYFAKRTALAGLGLPPGDYVASIHNRQLTNTFGIDKLKMLPQLHQNLSNLVGTRNYSTKKIILSIIYLGSLPKFKTDTVPPPLSEWGFS